MHVQAQRAIEHTSGVPLSEFLRSKPGETWARTTLASGERILASERKGHAVKILDLFVMRDYESLLAFLDTYEGMGYSRWLLTKDRRAGSTGY